MRFVNVIPTFTSRVGKLQQISKSSHSIRFHEYLLSHLTDYSARSILHIAERRLLPAVQGLTTEYYKTGELKTSNTM